MEITSEDPTTNEPTSVGEENHIPNVCQENVTSMVRENHITRTL